MHLNTLLLRLTAVAVTAGTLAGSAFAAPGTVTAQNGLRLRAQADSSSAVVKTLAKGTVVDVTATIDDEWYQVSVDNHTGYVSRDYIRLDESALSADRTGTVTAESGLFLRTKAAKNAPVLKTLSKGTIVCVLETGTDGWYHISVDNYIGYVSGEYIRLDEAAPSPQPEQAPTDTPPAQTETPADSRLGVVTALTLNIRSGPDTNHEKVGTLSLGAQVTIQGEENGWYKIEKGYISSEYISFDLNSVQAPKRTGFVNTASLNVRSGPSTVHTKVATLSSGEEVTILGEVDGWYKLENGYVSSEYITLSDGSKSGSLQSQIVAYAKKFLGYPYVLGGRGPNSFDCSGLVYYVYKNFGYTVNRTATTQLSDGVAVKKADLQPGDLVFFNSAGTGASRATHVGIYIGGGQFLHASSPKVGVVISDLYSNYYKRVYTTARRII